MAGNNFWFEQKTVNGYLAHEVASAMQKAIRRRQAHEAMFWASELLLSNLDGYCWKRLEIILVEDVDIFQPGLQADIYALRQIALSARSKDRTKPDERESLCLMAAVTKLAVAKKSRINCNATVFHCQIPRQKKWMPEIPDEALDRHTVKGKQMKRDWNHFFDEGAAIADDEGNLFVEDDPYIDHVRDFLNNKAKYEASRFRVDDKQDGLF